MELLSKSRNYWGVRSRSMERVMKCAFGLLDCEVRGSVEWVHG